MTLLHLCSFLLLLYALTVHAFTTYGNSGAIKFNDSYMINFRASGALVGASADCGISEVRNEVGGVTKRICVNPPIRWFKVFHSADMPQQILLKGIAGITLDRNPNVFETGAQLITDFLSQNQQMALHAIRRRQQLAGKHFGLESAATPSSPEGRDCVPDTTKCVNQFYCAALTDPTTDLATNLNNPSSCAAQYVKLNPPLAGGPMYSETFFYGPGGVCLDCPNTGQQNSDGSMQTQKCYSAPGTNLCVPDESEQDRPTCSLGGNDCAGTTFQYEPLLTAWFFQDDSYRVYQNEANALAVSNQLKTLAEDFSTINDRMTAIGNFMSNASTWIQGDQNNWVSTAQFNKDWVKFTTTTQNNMNNLGQSNLQTLADIGNLNSKTQQQFAGQFQQLSNLNAQSTALFTQAESILNATQQAIDVQGKQTNAINQRLQQVKVDMGRWADRVRDAIAALYVADMGRDFSRGLVQMSFKLQAQMIADGFQMFLYGWPNADGTYGQKPNPPTGSARFATFEQITAWSVSVDSNGHHQLHKDQAVMTCDNSYLLNNTFPWYVKRDVLRLLGSNTAAHPSQTGCTVTGANTPNVYSDCICWASITGEMCDMSQQSGTPVNTDITGPTYTGGRFDPSVSLVNMGSGCQSTNLVTYPVYNGPILPNTPLDGLALTLTNLANFTSWISTICQRQAVNPGVSKMVIHSANAQRIWVLPRLTDLCSSQYTDMAQESAATNSSLTPPFVVTELLSVAFKLFNKRRNTMERLFYGSLPQKGYAWFEEPFQQDYFTKEAANAKLVQMIGVHPEMWPIYEFSPVPGTATQSVVVTVETLQPDGTWVPDNDVVTDLWITSDFAHLADTNFTVIGFLECIRTPCQIPTLKPGFSGHLVQGIDRFVVDFPQRLWSASPFPGDRIGAINYIQFKPTGTPNVASKRKTPPLVQWVTEQGYIPDIAFPFDATSVRIDPSRYITHIIAPHNNMKGYFCSFQRTGNSELCTNFDALAFDFTPPVGGTTADDLTMVPGYYRSWSVEGRLKWPSSVITFQQPASLCPPQGTFRAQNDFQAPILILSNNTVNTPFGLVLKTQALSGAFPDCVRSISFVLPASTDLPLAPIQIPSCRTTAINIKITTTNGAETCWAWNATVYHVTIPPGRIEQLQVQWQVQDSSAVMLSKAAADMSGIVDDVENLIIQSILSFQSVFNESNVQARQVAFNQIAETNRIQFLQSNKNLTDRIAADARLSWTTGAQLGVWVNSSYSFYKQQIDTIQLQFSRLPNGTIFLRELDAANNQSAAIVARFDSDLALFLAIAKNYSNFLHLIGTSANFNWTGLGPSAYHCAFQLQKLLTSEPGVEGTQILTDIRNRRAALLDRRNRADCSVQGFLSMFNFACKAWNPLRITLWLEVTFLVALLLFFLLPGCGYNITANAYVGCRCCRKPTPKTVDHVSEQASLLPQQATSSSSHGIEMTSGRFNWS